MGPPTAPFRNALSSLCTSTRMSPGGNSAVLHKVILRSRTETAVQRSFHISTSQLAQRDQQSPVIPPSKTSPSPSSPSATSSPPPSPPSSSKPATSNKNDAQPLQVLPRPLGVPDVPTTAGKTWQERKDELMDRDLRKAKRKEIVGEALQGYFHDYHAARRDHGGKSWIAPSMLIREDRALYLPNISGTSLTDRRVTTHTTELCKGKVSLVAVLNTRLSDEHASSFAAPVLEDWEQDPLFQYVQINHQPNPLKSLLLQMTISAIRRSQPENRWPGYMISGGEWGGLKQPLGITNKLVGYMYLVDPNLKIRWAGCGYATDEEREGLRRSLAVLMQRSKETPKKIEEGNTTIGET